MKYLKKQKSIDKIDTPELYLSYLYHDLLHNYVAANVKQIVYNEYVDRKIHIDVKKSFNPNNYITHTERRTVGINIVGKVVGDLVEINSITFRNVTGNCIEIVTPTGFNKIPKPENYNEQDGYILIFIPYFTTDHKYFKEETTETEVSEDFYYTYSSDMTPDENRLVCVITDAKYKKFSKAFESRPDSKKKTLKVYKKSKLTEPEFLKYMEDHPYDINSTEVDVYNITDPKILELDDKIIPYDTISGLLYGSDSPPRMYKIPNEILEDIANSSLKDEYSENGVVYKITQFHLMFYRIMVNDNGKTFRLPAFTNHLVLQGKKQVNSMYINTPIDNSYMTYSICTKDKKVGADILKVYRFISPK